MTMPAERATAVSSEPEDIAVLAAAALLISDAYLEGAIDGDPGIARLRAQQILIDTRRLGIVPDPDEVEAKALELMAELGVIRR